MTQSFKEYYSPREAAKICKISHATVTNYCNRGEIACEKSAITSYIKIPRQSLLDFMSKYELETDQLIAQSPYKILIVDDNNVDRKFITTSIKTHIKEPITLDMAENGYEALITIGKELPDLVILDIVMPKMDGTEVCRQIKSNPNTSHIKVVVVSAQQDEESKKHLLELGADGYYSKPIDTLTLISGLKDQIKAKAS